MIVVDQPGHGDSADRDSEHYIQTNLVLEEHKNVTAYIMLINGGGEHDDSKECLARLRMNQKIYNNYFEKVIFVVSFWHYDPSSI